MKWTFFVKHKMAAAALLGTVMALVILNNVSEQRNSDELNNAFSSMYEDRLIAESYLLNMSGRLHEVNKITSASGQNAGDLRKELLPVIAQVNETIELYRKTKLTTQEEIEFAIFTGKIDQVSALVRAGNFERCRIITDEALTTLHVLSDIQVAEGSRLKDNSQRIFSSSISSSQFEIAILIIIGVIIQALVFSSRNLGGRAQQNYKLN
ncbi:MAG TPA: MCP four helix bundle domain-containing protein [Bacteroidia bacterium]|nr:MCP four helix bundle domain-containing protein [Bacteroidia bacterium]